MTKVLVFQHVAHKILGTLNPTLKERKLNLRYVNFDRTPEERPTIQKYHALIVLGGHMGVYEADKYQHIKVEMQLIEEALKKGIPVLGICLGAQLVANVLGASVRKHHSKEIGWYDVKLTDEGLKDNLFGHFKETEKVFQMHGDTFDIPHGAQKLIHSDSCESQAFRYGSNVYGMQFHLEVDEAMIHRWLSYESNLADIRESEGRFCVDKIKNDTSLHIESSIELSLRTFSNFVDLFAVKKTKIPLSSDHGQPLKKSILSKL